MVNDNLMLLDKDLSYAQNLCASINDRNIRNRTVANVIGTILAESYFDPEVVDIDAASGLHNVISILENYEISDIYINNFYVDVRVYFSEEEICVPKAHFDTGILPALYMFIKLSPDLSKAEVKGFVRPERIDKSHVADDVYYLSENDFETYYDIESKLMAQPDFCDVDDAKIYDFLEGSLSGADVISLLGELVKSKIARQKLIKCVNAQSVFNFISVNAQPVQVSNDESLNENEGDVITEDELDDLFNSENSLNEGMVEYSTSVTPSGAEVIESLDNEENAPAADENSEQIEALFTGEQEGIPVEKPKKQPRGLMALLIVVLLAAGGFFAYTKMSPKIAEDNAIEPKESIAAAPAEVQPEAEAAPQNTEEAMPVETVENNSASASVEEVTDSNAIPAIENSLDASVLVSNLKVDWEVPEGYTTNVAAKRYLLKLGKIIQLNLKTELLLLQKPPLSNKISVEIKYNPVSRRFETVGIKESSGEKSVDALIMSTVSGVLKMSVSYNMEFISKIPGNPVLIIHL